MPWPALAAFGCSFLISWLLTALLIRWSPHLGLLDQPDARKVHRRAVPGGGGLAIFAAVVLATWLIPGVPKEGMPVFLGIGLGIVLLGLVDDLRPLPWQFRLAAQLLAAVLAVYSGASNLGWLAGALAALWITALINAFNMLDNMDALSAGVAWIAAAALAVALWLRQQGPWNCQPALPYLVFMGALSGFLCFNRPPARIFMGDAGSTFLGFFLGVRSLDAVNTEEVQSWLWPLCILAVPWYDLTSVVLLRLWQGRSPFHADKQHLSHRLVELGLSSPAAVGVIYLLGLASGAAGLLFSQTGATGRILIIAQIVCWWLAVAAIEYLGRFHKRRFRKEPASD
jgi:UDP-GlcNAc:undecaprenyl-phosphate GlcNAc-1-phosphate transferase